MNHLEASGGRDRVCMAAPLIKLWWVVVSSGETLDRAVEERASVTKSSSEHQLEESRSSLIADIKRRKDVAGTHIRHFDWLVLGDVM